MVVLTLFETHRQEVTPRVTNRSAATYVRLLGNEQVYKYRFRVSRRGVREIRIKIQ